jgi:hypothetical protein
LLAPKSETFRSWLTRPHTIKSRRSASFLHPFRGPVGGRCGRDPGSRVRLGGSSLVSGRSSQAGRVSNWEITPPRRWRQELRSGRWWLRWYFQIVRQGG